MIRTISALSTALLALSLASPASAQDAMAGHDMSAMGGASINAPLPEVCLTDAGKQAAAAMPSMAAGHTVDMAEGNMALMAGMDQMHKDMMAGTMAGDVDVAFVCGMIPHHQGAITMARAELKYGDNDWAKAMAQKVIDAQEQEIADMLAWLEQQK